MVAFSPGQTMTVRRIESEEEYREALGTVPVLVDLDPAPGSLDGDRLITFVRLIEQYEAMFVQDRAARSG